MAKQRRKMVVGVENATMYVVLGHLNLDATGNGAYSISYKTGMCAHPRSYIVAFFFSSFLLFFFLSVLFSCMMCVFAHTITHYLNGLLLLLLVLAITEQWPCKRASSSLRFCSDAEWPTLAADDSMIHRKDRDAEAFFARATNNISQLSKECKAGLKKVLCLRFVAPRCDKVRSLLPPPNSRVWITESRWRLGVCSGELTPLMVMQAGLWELPPCEDWCDVVYSRCSSQFTETVRTALECTPRSQVDSCYGIPPDDSIDLWGKQTTETDQLKRNITKQ